jgi:hypothetical protein
MNGIFQMQGGKNWIFPKEMNANRFFLDYLWLEIWSNHFCPSMGPNGGIVAMDSELQQFEHARSFYHMWFRQAETCFRCIWYEIRARSHEVAC